MHVNVLGWSRIMIDSPSQTYKITIMNIPAEHENRSSTVKSVIMHKVRMLEDHTISRKHLCVIRYFTLTCSKVESKSPESSRTSNSASFFYMYFLHNKVNFIIFSYSYLRRLSTCQTSASGHDHLGLLRLWVCAAVGLQELVCVLLDSPLQP